jgi:hypothetical protein
MVLFMPQNIYGIDAAPKEPRVLPHYLVIAAFAGRWRQNRGARPGAAPSTASGPPTSAPPEFRQRRRRLDCGANVWRWLEDGVNLDIRGTPPGWPVMSTGR